MKKNMIAFFYDENGATAIEYSIIILGIATVIVLSVQDIGTKLNDIFLNVTEKYQKN